MGKRQRRRLRELGLRKEPNESVRQFANRRKAGRRRKGAKTDG